MNKSRLIGLKELVAAAKPEECPFCGAPRQRNGNSARWRQLNITPPAAAKVKTSGAPEGYNLTCGDSECAEVAYNRYWKRDANARKQTKKGHLSVTGARTAT